MAKKEKSNLIIEKVYSQINDKKISEDLMNSPIWKGAKHLEDVNVQDRQNDGYVYSIYFDGVTPISVISVDKLSKVG